MSDLDRKILEAKRLIEELEEQKRKEARRNEGIEAFDASVREIFSEYGLTERDLFLLKSTPIVEWIKVVGEQSSKPSFFEDLKNYFSKIVEKEIKSELKAKVEKKTKKSIPKPTLVIGKYRNPITDEVIEKKRRNPKPLDDWIEEFGLDMVQSWQVPVEA
ncbi:hypothetical protein [Marinicellulosiphila megalodicopiae]|uniref:hypothetical protein n=1 Tax=Marinicellulosiphila megalodicopiae TaxID=2724896 RepID=UPI003BB007E4